MARSCEEARTGDGPARTAAAASPHSDLHQPRDGRSGVVSSRSAEVRTPLTLIRGYVDLLTSDGADMSDEQRRFLGAIDRNVQVVLHRLGLSENRPQLVERT